MFIFTSLPVIVIVLVLVLEMAIRIGIENIIVTAIVIVNFMAPLIAIITEMVAERDSNSNGLSIRSSNNNNTNHSTCTNNNDTCNGDTIPQNSAPQAPNRNNAS